jgi:large subunit ribosomal protein L29
MNYEDLKAKTPDELNKMLLELKKEQMELRFKQSGGQVEKTHEIRAIRRNIARVQTAMNAPVEQAKPAKKAPAKKTAAKKTEKAA